MHRRSSFTVSGLPGLGIGHVLGVVTFVVAAAACSTPPLALHAAAESRQAVAEARTALAAAAEASNRAVMGVAEAAADARAHRKTLASRLATLPAIVESMHDENSSQLLEQVRPCVDEYGRVDDEVLTLAVEGSNARASHLEFVDAWTAADAFADGLTAAADAATAAPAIAAVREIQALQAPHIAEAGDAAMTVLESRIRTAADRARAAAGVAAANRRQAVTAALDRFLAINDEIISLSRRNTNVRSLALALGRRRAMAADCDGRLQQLDAALAAHRFGGTR